jgi:hypothetical protein
MMNRQPGTHAKKRAIMAMIASGDSAIVRKQRIKISLDLFHVFIAEGLASF